MLSPSIPAYLKSSFSTCDPAPFMHERSNWKNILFPAVEVSLNGPNICHAGAPRQSLREVWYCYRHQGFALTEGVLAPFSCTQSRTRECADLPLTCVVQKRAPKPPSLQAITPPIPTLTCKPSALRISRWARLEEGTETYTLTGRISGRAQANL